ncbi:hypothetical protein GCM10023238_05900 [Streptomyces heliomycini]
MSGEEAPPALETDPKRNPNYMADYADWIECMNGRGLKVDPLPNGEGWNYKAGTTPPETKIRSSRNA